MEVKSEGEKMSTAVQGYHSRPQVGIPTTQKSDNVSVHKRTSNLVVKSIAQIPLGAYTVYKHCCLVSKVSGKPEHKLE
jgi:hypothetical protein